MSNPVQLPLSSGCPKPARPMFTPQARLPCCLTRSRVLVCALAPGAMTKRPIVVATANRIICFIVLSSPPQRYRSRFSVIEDLRQEQLGAIGLGIGEEFLRRALLDDFT